MTPEATGSVDDLIHMMRPFRRRSDPVMAVQCGGYRDPLLPTFRRLPPPTDFGASNFAWSDTLRESILPGDWILMDSEGGFRVMRQRDFERQYEPAPPTKGSPTHG
jgi:hypothetical protein